MNREKIVLKNVRVHNLQGVDLTLPPNQLLVFTGVSGSGKSSLAFDTLYVEGQRRYVESLSTYARRYVGQMGKADVEHVSGLSPTISIEQKTVGKNPRSTVGTLTELYDYLRVLYARVGVPHCPVSGEAVTPQSKERIIRSIQALPEGSKIIILAPYAEGKKGEFREDFADLLRKGFMRVRVDGEIRNLGEDISLDGNLSHDVDVVIDRLQLRESEWSRVADSVTQALDLGEGRCRVMAKETGELTLYSMHAYSAKSGLSYSSLEPQDFSFNSPSGMCSRCQGMGRVQSFHVDKIIDPEKSIAQDCCSVASSYQTVRYGNIYRNLGELYDFDVDTPWKKLPKRAQKVFLHGTEKKWTRMHFVHPQRGTTWSDYVRWQGVLHEAHKRYTEATSAGYKRRMEALMADIVCDECHGSRLKAYPAATLFAKTRIHEICKMTIKEASDFFEAVKLQGNDATIAEELLKEIRQRLSFLLDVGLDYLTIDRTAPTLSGGEAQRVRLASQIGCGLVGVTYILDEPSIGLHPRDNKKLISTLQTLRDMGNSVIVVEHDEDTILAADRVVDFGPGPGKRGGRIVVNGSLKQLLSSKTSLTGAYLSGRRKIAVPPKRRKASGQLQIKGATHHNLKKLSAKLPLGCLVAITGVSGSGKSSLITDTLYPFLANKLNKAELPVGQVASIEGLDELDKVICIDQSPIGRNPRSNPSTYIKLFDEIRDLFAKLPESQARGYKPGRFSFNVREGSCAHCHGMGAVKVDMDFMDAAWVDCPVCRTRRFDDETLTVLYKGKNIYDILEMEVGTALKFFENIPSIRKKLETLEAVGLEYMHLGQPSTTLSGGEAQRIKLAKELGRPSTGRTLYILDEPTTGLHFHDIQHLLNVLHKLVDQGNSIVVIEHNMEVVKSADWILDIGPEGGAGGGRLVAQGTPELLARRKSPTGAAIHQALGERAEPASTKRAGGGQLRHIHVEAAQQNNLKHVDVTIPRGKMTICTGPSGSGKSSLAFDTVYAEGQRRYIESLSPYARQFVKQMSKPRVGQVEGLSPAVAIEQKAHAGNPRSTVGTMTEIYDYLRVLYARMGVAHCPETGEVIKAISKGHVVDRILALPEGERLHLLAPIELKKSERFEDLITRFQRQGYLRIRLNGEIYRLDEEIPFERRRKNVLYLVVDRLQASPTARQRIFEAVEAATTLSAGKVTLLRENGKEIPYNLAFCVESTGKSYPEITPQSFAFNTPEGMCPDCQGLGVQYGANLAQQADFLSMSVEGLIDLFWTDTRTYLPWDMIEAVLSDAGIELGDLLFDLSAEQLSLLFQGSKEEFELESGLSYRWVGINQVLTRLGKWGLKDYRELALPHLDESDCPSCEGTRLNPVARRVEIQGVQLGSLCRMPIAQSEAFIRKLKLKKEDAKLLDEVHSQLKNRLQFLCEVGLHYVALDRRAPSLSGGEAQRIRLARQLGSRLTGVLYVLDEPTIGLHPADTHKLHSALKKLKELGNTLLLVEHDPATIEKADYLLDFGPGSGHYGGHVTARGSLSQLKRNSRSLTGQYLSGKKRIEAPKKRRKKDLGVLAIHNASLHNLKNLSLQIPLGKMSCLTGVSGSGKSTLMHHILRPAVQRGINYEDAIDLGHGLVSGIAQLDRLIIIDQNPIGHTIRANVATYTDVMTPLRQFFSQLPEARVRGLMPKHFSSNHRRGMCTHCWGLGYKRVEMHFLPAVRVSCPECHGLRLNPVSLEVRYQGKNLGEYLQLTVDELRQIFDAIPRVKRLLDTLISVGLGYLTLSQQIVSLSGGEAQRLKLSRELTKRSTGNTLYLLDEPTTGLHSDDVAKLLEVLNQLVNKGNTVLLVEHNLDLIRCCDHIIDLGPQGGDAGGQIVAEGSPDEITQNKKSLTGDYLRELMS